MYLLVEYMDPQGKAATTEEPVRTSRCDKSSDSGTVARAQDLRSGFLVGNWGMDPYITPYNIVGNGGMDYGDHYWGLYRRQSIFVPEPHIICTFVFSFMIS